jgi:diguanylate cyclase (GGDEF)-like protein
VTARARRIGDAIIRTRATSLAFIAIWTIGLVGLTSVIGLETRIDSERRAQVAVETMERQVGDLVGVAFNPALSTGTAYRSPEDERQLAAGKAAINKSIISLQNIGSKQAQERIAGLVGPYFAGVDRLAALVAAGSSRQAAIEYGRDEQPTGSYGALVGELHRAASDDASGAQRARLIGAIGTVAAVLFMLVAFSLALYRATRLARENHQLLERSRVEALTDTLTGLPNRRKLFADMATLLEEPPQQLALAMYDLDGFKAYNDAFGHPAGDALLARVGQRLAQAVAGHGTAYRIGGDEFCVIIQGGDASAVLAAATVALSEHGSLFNVTSSRGSIAVTSGEVSLEQALHEADQRLYVSKRSTQGTAGQPRDVLLSVLGEQNQTLAAHMVRTGRLATAVAQRLGLSEIAVAQTCLAAELHDIGKTAIPISILDKPGPLDDDEWSFIKRHTLIGERILAATPALALVAPLVRSSHERPDGTGYPDGLREAEIPLCSSIVAAVDAYDAMTSSRPYSLPLTHDQALAELRAGSGSQFDPTVTDALIEVVQERSSLRASARPVPPALTA